MAHLSRLCDHLSAAAAAPASTRWVRTSPASQKPTSGQLGAMRRPWSDSRIGWMEIRLGSESYGVMTARNRTKY